MFKNRENDILDRTRLLIQGLKDYTDARVDEAAEEAVRRVLAERDRATKRRREERREMIAGVIGGIIFLFCIFCIAIMLVTVIDAPNRSIFQLVASCTVAASWILLVAVVFAIGCSG